MSAEMLKLYLRHRGYVRDRFEVWADPTDGDALRRIMRDAVHRDGGRDRDMGDYTLEVEPAHGRRFMFGAP